MLLSGGHAAQAIADLERAKAGYDLEIQQNAAHQRDVIAPLLQRREELKAARAQEHAALEQEYQRRDREIFERYRVELERIDALLREAAA